MKMLLFAKRSVLLTVFLTAFSLQPCFAAPGTKITIGGSGAQSATNIIEDNTHRFATDTEKARWDAKQDALTAGTDYATPAAVAAKLDANNPTHTGTMTGPGYNSNAADGTHFVQPYNSVTFSGTPSEGMLITNAAGQLLQYHGSAWIVFGGASSLAQLSDWPTAVSATEVGYLDGVTSAIQTQLTGKESTSNKNVVNGYAGIDANGAIATPQQTTPDVVGLRPGSGAGTNYIYTEGPATNPSTTWGMQWGVTEPSNGQVLTASTNTTHLWTLGWTSPLTNPMTTAGDMIVGGASGAPARLADVEVGSVLMSGGVGAAPIYCAGYVAAATAQTPTAASLACGPTFDNYGQAAANINNTLPTPTQTGQGFVASVGTAQGANYWRFTATTAGTIYLDGSGTGKDYVQFTTPAVGDYYACFAQQTGASTWRWNCKSGAGTVATN